MNASEFLVHISFCCALFGGLILIVMWRQDVKETKKSEEGV